MLIGYHAQVKKIILVIIVLALCTSGAYLLQHYQPTSAQIGQNTQVNPEFEPVPTTSPSPLAQRQQRISDKLDTILATHPYFASSGSRVEAVDVDIPPVELDATQTPAITIRLTAPAHQMPTHTLVTELTQALQNELAESVLIKLEVTTYQIIQ